MEIRQPIVTIAGHVDHGKTSILDKLRGTTVAEKEAGNITQKISFTLFPAKKIKKECKLIDKHGLELKIPGFLFVDTPGHQAFTNLRKRSGSLADLAILVIDINEGIMPQTAEVLKIFKENKIPFIIALNKVDRLSGWRKQKGDIKKSIESQSEMAKKSFNESLYQLMASLSNHGFESDLFYNIDNFKKKVALVPCSAETSEGLPELLMVLCGLSQKFLEKQLQLGDKAKGVIFEIKKEKSVNHIEAILYDGKLKQDDKIAIATFEKPIVTKVRVLEEILPLSNKFSNKKKVKAATGIRIQPTEKEGVLPGMPFQIFEDNLSKLEKEFKQEIEKAVKTNNKGIIVKADSLGSLEALITLLNQNNIKVLKAGIGPVNKADIISARANNKKDPLLGVILGFNVGINDEAKAMEGNIKIFTDEVVYKLIENLQEWKTEKIKEIERQKLSEFTSIFKLEIMPDYVFRDRNPAIFGVKIAGGKLKPNNRVISEEGEKIGRIKNIQSENKSVDEAGRKEEVAISIPGTTFSRKLKEVKTLYPDISKEEYRKFKENKDLLSNEEKTILREIAEIKRKENPVWGI